MSIFRLILLSCAAGLIAVVFTTGMGVCEEATNLRHEYTTALFFYSDERTDMPVFCYRCSSGHHGQWISDSELKTILIWSDGTIAWEIAPKEKRYDTRWYQTTVPAEKIEAAVKEITESFAKYPVKNRLRRGGMTLRLGANHSPSIAVYSSQHYENFMTDILLWEFYKENRETLQSGDDETIVETIAKVGGFPSGKINPDGTYTGLHPAYMFDYRSLIEAYREKFPDAGLSEKRNPVYKEEEILKCMELFKADMEHIFLVEKKILDLLPATEGLQAKKLDTKSRYFLVEREIKDGKSEFFYSPMTDAEYRKRIDKIMQGNREERERKAKE